MRVAITGGTGFVGSHLARRLIYEGHEVILIGRGIRDVNIAAKVVCTSVDDPTALAGAFAGCDAVAHCAGINREIGQQTYQRVHIEGTRSVVEAAAQAGVRKVVLLSFLRARPSCGSPYHESKWAAEEIVRTSGLDYTILKSGMIYGRGDHMLDHISHSLYTQPFFMTVGLREKTIRPVAIEDLVEIMRAALVDSALSRATVAVTGPDEITLSEAVRRVAATIGRRVFVVPGPLALQYGLAWLFERLMRVPLVAIAQVRILAEGVTESLPVAEPLPAELQPRRMFTGQQIRSGLPAAGRFTTRDLRCCAAR